MRFISTSFHQKYYIAYYLMSLYMARQMQSSSWKIEFGWKTFLKKVPSRLVGRIGPVLIRPMFCVGSAFGSIKFLPASMMSDAITTELVVLTSVDWLQRRFCPPILKFLSIYVAFSCSLSCTSLWKTIAFMMPVVSANANSAFSSITFFHHQNA